MTQVLPVTIRRTCTCKSLNTATAAVALKFIIAFVSAMKCHGMVLPVSSNYQCFGTEV